LLLLLVLVLVLVLLVLGTQASATPQAALLAEPALPPCSTVPRALQVYWTPMP
jgi:hypothetical protein